MYCEFVLCSKEAQMEVWWANLAILQTEFHDHVTLACTDHFYELVRNKFVVVLGYSHTGFEECSGHMLPEEMYAPGPKDSVDAS